MSPKFEFGCLPTVIGSMPHQNAQEVCRLLLRYLPAIPAWPQLPHLSFRENMYVQFSEGFPGITIKEEHIYVDRSQDLDPALEQLYAAYLENNTTSYAVSPEYAAGLHAFLSSEIKPPLAAKGQLTGPISWGLFITDQQRYPVIYDETLAEAVARHLRLKASWQEKALSQISPTTIIFVDEPYLTSLGSAFVSLPSERVTALLKEVLAGISGLKGVHCCGDTDWSLVLSLPINILSFDTYNYATTLSLYPAEVKSFLERRGTIAWGIIPNEEETLAKETLASLSDRLEEAIAPFTREGLRFRQLIEQGLLTPSCGLASLSPEAAEQALEFLGQLSTKLRKRYII
jgi:methionine synthase II (cobalamin-independent)